MEKFSDLLHVRVQCSTTLQIIFCIFFQEKNKPQGDITQSPRAMAKFLKEAARVKQVLSANSEIFAQVSLVLPDTCWLNDWLAGQ